MDVPATLGECWAQGCRWTCRRYCGNAGARALTHERVPPTQAPVGTNPRTGPLSGTPSCYFFNLASVFALVLQRTFTAWEVVRTWAVAELSYGMLEIADYFGWSIPPKFLGTVVFPVCHSRRLYRFCLSLELSLVSGSVARLSWPSYLCSRTYRSWMIEFRVLKGSKGLFGRTVF